MHDSLSFQIITAVSQETDANQRELPRAFAPLEFLIGRWKGQGVRKDDPALRFEGWTETHTWAWLFAKGKPVGMTSTVEGGKILEKAIADIRREAGTLSPRRQDGRGNVVSNTWHA